MIPIKSETDLEIMREAGKILAGVLQEIQKFIRSGITTLEIDRLAEQLASQRQAVCAFKGYKGYPANICVSVNEEIVHGIPGERVLREGDVASIDMGIQYKGYFTDAAITVGIGEVPPGKKKLIAVTKKALAIGIQKVRQNNRVSDISYAIQGFVEKNGFSVVRQFVGHGIGLSLHEEPEVPNFGRPNEGALLKPGMVLAIEPMVNMGTWEAEILENGWTAVTKDRRASAHFEHTVVITAGGPEILTN